MGLFRELFHTEMLNCVRDSLIPSQGVPQKLNVRITLREKKPPKQTKGQTKRDFHLHG